MQLDDINKLFQKLDDASPLVEFTEPMQDIDWKMQEALARMYADEGFRNYLILCYNRCIKETALKTKTEIDIAYGKARALTIKELLIKSRDAFLKFEKITNKKKETQYVSQKEKK
jgi:hypothetical protein